MFRIVQKAVFSILICATCLVSADDMQEVKVWGQSLSSRDTGYTSPISVFEPKELESINATTTEDLVAYEPSLIIRKRFIGDANGTLGIRGSNMFQTARSMVFADGVPLHYLLQSRWNGAPRWSMVSASEIDKVEVIYGPFSAEYGGNAMGGVVLIETGIPQKEEFHANITAFQQSFDDYGYEDTIGGYKGFISYGNRVGDFSYFLSFNQLDNRSQPQTFRGASPNNVDGGETAVSGGGFGLDARQRPIVVYGDTGEVETETQNYKVKLGYDFGRWESLFNFAYEDRGSYNIGNSYIRNTNDIALWRGNFTQDGQAFSFNSGRINEREMERDSLSLGLRVRGDIAENTQLEFNLNQFSILKDEERESDLHPNDPQYTESGQIERFDDSGWETAEAKLTFNQVGNRTLDLITGLRYERYELNLEQFDSEDYAAGNRTEISSRFGGDTYIAALFSQLNWDINEHWDLAAGLRYEDFAARGGYYSTGAVADNDFTLINTPELDNDRVSPKLSIAYQPNELWLMRYSFAKAYRFPIVEELYRQYRDFNTINESNPELKPEDGTHHNLMFERALEDGYLRFNLFYETINEAIVSQSTTLPSGQSINSFVPVDETQTQGIEFIFNRYSVLPNVDIRFNVSYADAEIVANSANTALEGNTFPRMPKWRGNLLSTYHISPLWNVGLSIRYASDSFGRLQNDDRTDKVYGAQDAFTFVGVKTNYELSDTWTLSAGIDNLNDELAYVAHPWPGRTLYFTLNYDM